jgi:hypothetical protein
VVGAEEESLRIKAGAATYGATRVATKPNASHAIGIHSTQFCQNVYGKPGALFSVNRLSVAEALKGSLATGLIGRAMVWKSRTN